MDCGYPEHASIAPLLAINNRQKSSTIAAPAYHTQADRRAIVKCGTRENWDALNDIASDAARGGSGFSFEAAARVLAEPPISCSTLEFHESLILSPSALQVSSSCLHTMSGSHCSQLLSGPSFSLR